MSEKIDFVNDFPAWLEHALKAANWRRIDLARASGVPRCHISKIILGDVDPRLSTIARLVNALAERNKAL